MKPLLFFLLTLSAALPAHARLTINLTYDSSVNTYAHKAELENALNYSVSEYGKLLIDDVTVNIKVEVDSDSNDYGSSYTNYPTAYTYNQVRNALISHAKTLADATGIANSWPATDPTGGGMFYLSSANAKSLGLRAADDPGIDGTFSFGSPITWAFDPNNRKVPGATDFIGTADHEFSEIMGRNTNLDCCHTQFMPFDLFHYTGAGKRTFTPWAAGAYFSIDGGVTPLIYFNTDNDGDPQDWANPIYDSYTWYGDVNIEFVITPVDITTMDVIGYTPAPTLRDFVGNARGGAVIYDSSSGQSYTALSNGDGTYNYKPNLISPSFDTLRIGDYNGDRKADLIVYNSHTASAYIGFGNGDGTFNFQSLFWSPGYDTVEIGDINGDGKMDVALYNSTTGTLYTGISNGDGTFTYQYHLVSQGFTFVRLADFAGNGNAGLFLYNSTNGQAVLGLGDGAGNFTFHPLFISSGYNLADTGDLNGDGKADLILYNGTNGNAATGIGDGAGGFTFKPLVFSPGFTSVRLGDFTGAGRADVTVYNKNNGNAYFGAGDGAGNFAFGSLFWSPGYDFVIPVDVNGDGTTDIELYNSSTGTEYTGVSNFEGATSFTYTYQYWGIGKVLAR